MTLLLKPFRYSCYRAIGITMEGENKEVLTIK